MLQFLNIKKLRHYLKINRNQRYLTSLIPLISNLSLGIILKKHNDDTKGVGDNSIALIFHCMT